ncbi:MAG TPA: hypothetical protein VMI12_09545 [Puia sp.]|nr:hypothetical protein [Puia sp.]
MRAPLKYLFGIFLLSFSTLLFELSLTRVFSVTLWYHFGFLIISTALLGFGVSGVLLSLWKKLREEYELDKLLGILSICLSISIIVCFWLLQKIPFDPFSLYADAHQFIYMPLTYILVSVPFFFAGLALSVLFTRFPGSINRLYAFDLTGAALGSIAIIISIPHLGGGGSVIFAAFFGGIAALLFSWTKYKTQAAIGILLTLISAFVSHHSDQLIPLRVTNNKHHARIKPIFTKWNTFSKVDLYDYPSSLDSTRSAPTFIIDDGTAATGLMIDLKPGIRETLKQFPGDTLYESCLAYILKKNPEVLIIGSGCGTQVMDALHYGAKKIVAVDINPIINNVVYSLRNDLWGNMFHQPEVKLVTEEGRNYVRSTSEHFDAIVSVHTISNAAIASGALSLAENYVLTKEAFEDFYDHLSDSGTIYFTRPEFQLPRLFATCREVLEEHGVKDFSRHFFSYTYPGEGKERKSFYSIFIVSKSPFSNEQVGHMKSFVTSMNGGASYLFEPSGEYKNIYDSILHTTDLPQLYHQYPFEISPATDNQPFFNHHTRWSTLKYQDIKDIFTQQKMGRMALEDKPIAEVSLLVLLFQVLIVSAVFILFPLWRFSSEGLKNKGIFPWLVYFSGLGCGFIMVELVLIQEFGLLLGEPVYSIAIVLASLLLFTGFGAYLSGRFVKDAQRSLKKFIPLLAILLLLASFFLPSILRSAIALPMTGRIFLTILLVMPFGILLGMPFPLGITLVGNKSPALIPWAWGVNGFFTVIGSVLALILSMMIGFQAVLWIAIFIYLLSLLVISKK